MNEVIEYLDYIGHKLGIGGFEGVIGAAVLLLAAIVLIVNVFSLLMRRTPKCQSDRHLRNPLEWMEDAEKTIHCDRKSKALSPIWDSLPYNIWHKKSN